MDELEKVKSFTQGAEKWRSECINLIASENVMSPLARSLYNSDFMHRYAEGEPGNRYYQGTCYIDEVEKAAIGLSKKLFRCRHADVQAISGCIANLAVFAAFGKPGDLLMSTGTAAGAHISHERFGAAGVRGLSVEHLVFDVDSYMLDVDASARKMREYLPKILVLGGSVMLFPHPVKELSKVAREIDAKVVYDAAHVLGLIAGRRFQDPLREGAGVITASTHKTFPGPQGGIILSEAGDEAWKRVKAKLFPGLLSNHHLHRLPALAVTLLEMLKFGKKYAKDTVENAQALAQAFHEEGMAVVGEENGFTESHQVLLDVRKFGSSSELVKRLEAANIICNKNLLAWDDIHSTRDPSGIRLGTQEMTRFGMGKGEMKEIASLFVRIVNGEKPDKVRKDVVAFRKEFPDVEYALAHPVDLLGSLAP